MKLIATELGQALQLFAADELRPSKGLYVPDVVRAISERYRFIKVPVEFPAEIQNLKFETGVITIRGETIPILNLDIYGDGIIVNVRHTTDADKVLDDFLGWATRTLEFRNIQTQFPRQYFSSIVVDFDLSISRLIKKFDHICDVLSAAFERENQEAHYKPYLSHLSFSPDPAEASPFARAAFTIEPRAGIPFSNNRYFSTAPLITESHLESLQEIEDVLRD